MQRQAEKTDPAKEAEEKGMTLSYKPYSIPGRGDVYIATDKPMDSFPSIDDYVKYVYRHRNDPNKVRFINKDAQNRYRAPSEQNIIANEIARQERVDVGPPPFQGEAERAERAAARRQREPKTETISVIYAGSTVQIEIDLSRMKQAEKDSLHKDMERMGPRPGEAALSDFLQRYHPDITNITVAGSRRTVGLDDPRETIADINSITRHDEYA